MRDPAIMGSLLRIRAAYIEVDDAISGCGSRVADGVEAAGAVPGVVDTRAHSQEGRQHE